MYKRQKKEDRIWRLVFQTVSNKFLDIFLRDIPYFVGDFYYSPSSGRKFSGNFPAGADFDSIRNLFYSQDQISSFPSFFRYDPGGYREKGKWTEGRDFRRTGPDRVYGNKSRYGKPGGRSAAISAGGAGAVFWMWLIALLGSSTAFAEPLWPSFIRKKIPFTAVIGRPCLLHTLLFQKDQRQEQEIHYGLPFCLSGLIC